MEILNLHPAFLIGCIIVLIGIIILAFNTLLEPTSRIYYGNLGSSGAGIDNGSYNRLYDYDDRYDDRYDYRGNRRYYRRNTGEYYGRRRRGNGGGFFAFLIVVSIFALALSANDNVKKENSVLTYTGLVPAEKPILAPKHVPEQNKQADEILSSNDPEQQQTPEEENIMQMETVHVSESGYLLQTDCFSNFSQARQRVNILKEKYEMPSGIIQKIVDDEIKYATCLGPFLTLREANDFNKRNNLKGMVQAYENFAAIGVLNH